MRRLSAPQLVGREAERELLAGALGRPPSIVLVEGEAGVGKTRLVEEVLAAPGLQARRQLVGHCQPLRDPFPLGPLIEALCTLPLPADLNPVVGALGPLLPEVADRLPPAPAPLEDPRAARHRTFRAVTELLGALGPTIAVIEDAHWADETTVELLQVLAAAPPAALALLITYRPEELSGESPLLGLGTRLPPAAVGLRVALPPLDVGDVGRLVGAILDAEDVSAEFATYLHDKTGGLPFAIEEVLLLMQDRRELIRRDGRWARQALDRLAVPTAVRESIRERVARLDRDARKVVEALAVLGRPAADPVLAATAGIDVGALHGPLTTALASGVIVERPPDHTDFRHALARQSVYDLLPGPRRRALHLAAAAALESAAGEGPSPVAQLAFHHERAGRHADAAAYAEAAADVAAARLDDVAVCRFLQQALAAPGLARDARVRMATRLAQAALHAFDHEEAAKVVRRVLDEEPLTGADRGALRRELGILLVQAGDASAGVAEMARAMDDLADFPELAMRTALSLAAPWVVEGDVTDHRGWLARGEAIAIADRSDEDHIRFLVDRATALTSLADPGAPEAEAAIPSDADGLLQRRALQRGCLNLAQAAMYIGAYSRAEGFLERFTQLAARTPSALFEGLQQTTTVLLDWHTGRWAGLDERAEALCRSMADVPHAAVDVGAVAGLLDLARTADPRRAVERLEPLLATARRAGSLPVMAMVAGGLTDVLLSAGRPDAALAVGRPALDVLAAKGTWGWAGDVAPGVVAALAATGAVADAAALTDRFADAVATLDAPAAIPAVALCRAAVARVRGDVGAAADAYDVARTCWAALPRPYEAARAGVAMGCCLMAAGDARGEEIGLRALEDLRPLGAHGAAARARRELRSQGASLPYRWKGGRRGYGNELSPRESEVVTLVKEGMTNREIAEALFLSVRTVEYHVAKALQKLGMPSRRQLAQAARQEVPT